VYSNFGIGIDGEEGGNDYSLTVGTPRAFDHSIQNSGPVWGRHYLIVNRYDPEQIRQYIDKKIVECERTTMEETYVVLSRYFQWEFEDYQPYVGL